MNGQETKSVPASEIRYSGPPEIARHHDGQRRALRWQFESIEGDPFRIAAGGRRHVLARVAGGKKVSPDLYSIRDGRHVAEAQARSKVGMGEERGCSSPLPSRVITRSPVELSTGPFHSQSTGVLGQAAFKNLNGQCIVAVGITFASRYF